MIITFELDVDDALAKEFESLSAENKSLFKHAVYKMLQKAAGKIRAQKIKTFLADIKKGDANFDCDPEILLSIIRTEEY